MTAKSISDISIRERKAADTPHLKAVLTEVYNTTGYPVDGPSSFDTFLSPTPEEVLYSIVATTSQLNPRPTRLICGTATLMAPTLDLSNLASRTFVQEHGGSIASHAILSRFFTRPNVQKGGIGRALLRECLRWGDENGRGIVLVVLDKDEPARRMYESEGFTLCGESVYISKQGVRYGCFAYLGPALA